MGLFDRKEGGFMDRANAYMTPDRAAAFSAIGLGMSQLGAGQPVNLSSSLNALQKRQETAKLRETLKSGGFMDNFTPQQQAILATMPPQLAQKVIAEKAFAPPASPTKGVSVGGSIVNPITGEVIYQGGGADRKIVKGADGFQYYQDTGERVLPDVEQAQQFGAAYNGLDAQAQAGGLIPGTPDYESFMRNGGGDPATFRALDMQAQAAGFERGTPEYENFMATRGAGIAAGAKEAAKNEATAATGEAAAAAKARGAAIGKEEGSDAASLKRQRSQLPGLYTVVDKLGELGREATYTTAGRALDMGRKELGLPPREAAVARAEYIAMVDNQVLPLLRDTFGAAFTAAEGESLRNTLGDPNKSPEEKEVVLRAFIDQKVRNIEALQMQEGQAPQPVPLAAPIAGDDPLGIFK